VPLLMLMAIYQHGNKINIFQITAWRCVRVRYRMVQDAILVREYDTEACLDTEMVLYN